MSRLFEQKNVSQITNSMTSSNFTDKQIRLNIGIPESDLTPIQRLFKHMYKDEYLSRHIESKMPETVIKLMHQPFHISHDGSFYELQTYMHDRIIVFKTKYWDKMIAYVKDYLAWNS